ncbi:MAG: argininosuccinate synthase [Methanocalculus sp.]|uniref:argininosuccinate synthase n=1 Tax=Methanocalculus sp. TaxID=2004547 RepID=UPI00271E5851|nr:argininosuccinate synthase [Methanocalculus sp.]MDO8842279.1 argininosuccinate synthase [Methanocalculus sp.]MDO9540596.1 argininosuccinate synthase [Methanocalculus sp.]
MTRRRIRYIALVLFLLLIAGTVHAAPTTSVYVVKIADDQTTILDEKTVDHLWMEANLPVLGDGRTRYYHQGPVFDGDKWDQNETTNFKDRGAVKGTDVKDLCELVSGAEPGDDIMIRAADGYHVVYPYSNIYTPDPRQGPIGICWYNGADSGAGERQGTGYVPDYYMGMRVVFFADNSTNAEGLHVYGNYDMYETLPDSAQHFYDLLPSTSGLSIKWVDEIRIYRGGFTGDRGSLASSLNEKPAPTTQAQAPLTLAPLIGGFCIAGLILWRRV